MNVTFVYKKNLNNKINSNIVRKLHIREDIDFAGMTLTTQTTTVHFEGFSLTLKNQSDEIKCLGVFIFLIKIILTFENTGVT